MTLKNTLKTALTGLQTNKSRTVLTVLGIVIGIAAIILITSIGQGAQDLIISQFQGLGSKTIIITPGKEPKGPSDMMQAMFGDSLKEKDLEALSKKSNVPFVKSVIPMTAGADAATYSNETYRLTLVGTSEGILDVFGIEPKSGRFFTIDDIKGKADVVVIGSRVKEELFGQSEAIGQKIKIKNRNLRVIGVLSQKGQVSLFNFDELAFIPYTTAQQYILGIKYFHHFIIETESQDAVPQTVLDIKRTLRISHGITDPVNDDFNLSTSADMIERVGIITDIFTLFLVIVAAISLIVGGIGIMNVMLISILERTREIGLRKALGATDKDILAQFLLEAILMTVAGGIIGIILGASLSLFTSIILTQFLALGWKFTFPILPALLGLTVSAMIGLVFGIYPARKAAQKSPIEALRYE